MAGPVASGYVFHETGCALPIDGNGVQSGRAAGGHCFYLCFGHTSRQLAAAGRSRGIFYKPAGFIYCRVFIGYIVVRVLPVQAG